MFAKRLHIVVLVAGMALPLMMGQGCPDGSVAGNGNGQGQGNGGGNGNGNGNGNGQGGGVQGAQPTTLLTNTKTALGPVFIFFGTFNPTSAGKVISVNVSGNTTGSRPFVQVRDTAGNIVAQELFPVTNSTSLSFVSTSTGDHRIFALENGAPASLYTLTAIQQP